MALFVDDVGLVDEWFTLRDLRCCYVLARMTAVDEYSVRKNEQLTFVDFLVGHVAPPHTTFTPGSHVAPPRRYAHCTQHHTTENGDVANKQLSPWWTYC